MTTSLTLLKYLTKNKGCCGVSKLNQYMMRTHATYPSTVFKEMHKLQVDGLVEFDNGGVSSRELIDKLLKVADPTDDATPPAVYRITQAGRKLLKTTAKAKSFWNGK